MWEYKETTYTMKQWCELAASYIRFPPDRPAVEQELMEHLQDKVDDFISHGIPKIEAERKAVQEMGEPKETGMLLRQIHKPYLGWVWRITQWIVGILLVYSLIHLWGWVRDMNLQAETGFAYRDPFSSLENVSSAQSDGGYDQRVLYVEPDCSAKLDGYTFKLTKAACWEDYYTADSVVSDYSRMYFLVEVSNLSPWLVETDLPRWFYAVDSLGNHYYSSHENTYTYEPSIHGNGHRTGIFTQTWYMWTENYVSQEAEWLELRFERDGKELSLRVDLTGGEEA